MPNQILIDVANALRKTSIETRAIAKRKNCTKDDQFDAVATIIQDYLAKYFETVFEYKRDSYEHERDSNYYDPDNNEVILKLHPASE